MIPITLEIKNFLSYGDSVQTIEFGNHSLICLSGKNGNGKSALLDAITWALWGQARKTTGVSKADEGLVRLGQKRMMVCLTFLFANKTYRVRREYEKSYGKPLASLDFQSLNESTQQFISLTDKTIRATQKNIQDLLGIDFETFINSAFVRQGQSNEFSKKSPRERKQIISSILGLTQYDQLQQLALTQVKKFTEEQKRLREQLATEQANLEKENTLIKQKEETKLTIESLKKRLLQLQEQLVNEEKKRTEIELTHQTFAQLIAKITDLEKNIAQNKTSYFQATQSWREKHRQLMRHSEAELKKEKIDLEQQESTYRKKQEESLHIQTTLLNIKQHYQEYRNTIEQKIKEKTYQIQLECNNLTTKKDKLYEQCLKASDAQAKTSQQIKILQEEHNSLQESLKHRALFEIKLEEEKLQLEKRKITYQSLLNQGKSWNSAKKELDHKKRGVQDLQHPACPLCEQLLTIKRKRHLIAQFEEQEQFIQWRISRLSSVIKKLKTLCINQHEKIITDNAKHQQFIAQSKQAEVIEKNLIQKKEDLENLNKEYQKEKDELKKIELQHTLSNQNLDKAHKQYQKELSENSELKKLYAEQLAQKKYLKEIAYNQIDHDNIKKRLKDIAALINNEKQERLVAEQQQVKERCITLRQLIRHLQKEKLLCDKQKSSFSSETLDLKQVDLVLTNLKKEIAENQLHLEERLKIFSQFEYELSHLNSLKNEYALHKEQSLVIENEIEDYQTLAHIFSKDGIQAVLIEEAIPEIEKEANDILARLTDNQSQIFIESLRDLKSGKVKETLDIQIADSIGIRPYEMFSGGEAFRIDFSLRIAISKLLARRAGTSLQTLIIDEGFGSQDEDGLRSIMHALHTIQEDFSKIIIVSHLLEFKENFPIHFVIEKNSLGSHVRIEEKG